MILLKKAVRAMWGNKKAYIACIVLIAVGMLIYVAMGIATNSLRLSRDKYYSDYHMADVFAGVTALSRSGAAQAGRVEGVAEAMPRIVYDSRVDMPGNDKIITLRLISRDPQYDGLRLNDILYEGTLPNDSGQIMVGKAFMTAHKLRNGDTITLIIQGKSCVFTICAAIQSPEYVYTIKDAKEVLPDPETFSFAYVDEDTLAALTNRAELYNDICFTLQSGYTFDNVKIPLEDALRPYGLISLIARKDQVSATMLDTEINSNTSMSTSVPFVFVFMAVVVLYLMLKRVIEQDRTQIGTLKAFGYTSGAILRHYLLYGAVTGLLGGVLGVYLGYLLAGSMLDMYKVYFALPQMTRYSALTFVAAGLCIAILSGVAGAYAGARRMLALSPADAMRPPSPKAVTRDPLARLRFFTVLLTSRGFMALRNMERAKVRSLFVAVGIMFSFGILAFMGSYNSMFDSMLLNQFTRIQLYDGRVSFQTPAPVVGGLQSVNRLPGVTLAEPLMEIPVELKHNNRKKGIIITGLPENAQLYKIYDEKTRRNLPPPQNGLILTNALADSLEAGVGDTLYLSYPGLPDDLKISVAGIVTQNLGSSCYMEMNALSGFLRLPAAATSVMFSTTDMAAAKAALTDGQNVAVIEDKVRTLETYRSFLGSYTYLFGLMEVMAAVVAFAIIYNTSNISLSERKREYATLRVLGLQVKEVGEIVAFEYWLLCALGMGLGVPFTWFLKHTVAQMMTAEMFTMPTSTPLSAYLTGVVGCLCAVWVSNYSAVRNIRKFDMVDVLKERE